MAGDPNYAKAALLLHFNGTNGDYFTKDSSPNPKQITFLGNSPQISNTQSVFGGTSLYCPSQGVMIGHDADFVLGNRNWTLDLRIYPTTNYGSQSVMVINNNHPPDYSDIMVYKNSTEFAFYMTSNRSSWDIASGVYWKAYTPNTVWYNLRLVRSGNTLYYFADGVLVGTIAWSGSFTYASNTQSGIGQSNNGSSGADCYVDEVALYMDVALSTANYTIPASPFLDYAGQISGNITESFPITDWEVTARRVSDGKIAGSTVTSGTSYTINCKTLEMCNTHIAPKIHGYWVAGKSVNLNEFYVPSNPNTTPRLYKVTTAGAFDPVTEAAWPTSGSVTQGTAVLAYVADLDNGMFKQIGCKFPA